MNAGRSPLRCGRDADLRGRDRATNPSRRTTTSGCGRRPETRGLISVRSNGLRVLLRCRTQVRHWEWGAPEPGLDGTAEHRRYLAGRRGTETFEAHAAAVGGAHAGALGRPAHTADRGRVDADPVLRGAGRADRHGKVSSRGVPRREYLADDLAAEVASIEAARELMESLLHAGQVDRELRLLANEATAFAGRESAPSKDETLWPRLAGHLASIPPRERERLRRISAWGGHRQDATHPPTRLRGRPRRGDGAGRGA
jgi:hypothetical protein